MRRAFCLLALTCACRPDFGEPASHVTGPRILAVRANPPEAAPGATVRLEALAVTPAGTEAAPPIRWDFCSSPKPLTENDVVGPDCFAGAVRPIGDGPAIDGSIPNDACLLFGPETPQPVPGQPPFRARDPDVTGGYYQPVRLRLGGEDAIGLPRVTCNLVQASADIARDYRQRYRANVNPTLAQVEVPATVAPGARVTLRASWPSASAETFVVYDVTRQALVEQRESLRVSWFASAGSFRSESTGRAADEQETSTSNDWTAPAATGPVQLWVVLRDSRGGVDFRSVTVTVAR